MKDQKLEERKEKFSRNKNESSFCNNLVRRREEMNMTLRKNQLYDNFLERRIKKLKELKSLKDEDNNKLNNSEKFSNTYEDLELKLSKLEIPKILLMNYQKSEDKLIIISKLLNQKIIDDTDFVQEENCRRFAILQLRMFLSNSDDEKLPSNEEELIILNIYPILEKILLSKIELESTNTERLFKDVQLLYEVTWILIDLSSSSSEIVNKLIQINLLERLDLLIDECIKINQLHKINTSSLIRHVFWIFANILIESEQCNIIIKNSVKIKSQMIKFLSSPVIETTSTKLWCDLILTILWTVQNFLEYSFPEVKYNYRDLMTCVINLTKLACVNCNNDKENKTLEINIIKDGIYAIAKFNNCAQLIDIMLENQIVPLLLSCISLPIDGECMMHIAKIFLELSTGTNDQITSILNYNILDRFNDILCNINNNSYSMLIDTYNDIGSPNQNNQNDIKLVKEICLCISNFCASSEEIISSIITNKKIINTILSIYGNFPFSVKFEILFIFFNSFKVGSNFIKSEILRIQVPQLFMSMLINIYESNIWCKGQNQNFVNLILLGIEEFLLYGEKITSKVNIIQKEFENENLPGILEALQFSEVPEIYEVAHRLYLNYWGESDNYYERPSDLYFNNFK